MKIDPNRGYRRIEIDEVFTKRKQEMHAAALKRGKSKGLDRALYSDCYTGKTLIGGDPYDYEHLRSAEELHSRLKHQLTDEQIAQVVNCPENVSVTLTEINRSKGKRRMEDWMSKPDNIAIHGINVQLALENLRKADEGIERSVKKLIC